ncbi:MAG: transglycosylase domain-containing protein, partial [Acidimicrobiales bacterium]
MRSPLKAFAAFLVVSVATPAVATGVVFGAMIFLPLPATLPTAKPGLESRISHVLDKDGNEIAIFREFETSVPFKPEDVPLILKQAVVTAEDRDFYEHGGLDPRGIMRALIADIRTGQPVQGGSTITQQYVRLAYEQVGTERTISRKIREAILAAQLERQEDKEAILFGYLSRIYLGEGAYGVEAASETYFRKPVNQLALSESALLAGLIPAPSRYSPRVDPATADQKRIIVLDAMLDEGYIDQPTHDAAVAEHVWLWVPDTPPPGPVTVVYPPVQQQTSEPWFTDYVRVTLEQFFGCPPGNCPQITRGGLTIQTTMDSRAQAIATEELHRQMDANDPELQMAIVSVEPPTGYVRAMVGGRDWAYSQVNTALSGRATGSAFKPFVLTTALAQGVQ